MPLPAFDTKESPTRADGVFPPWAIQYTISRPDGGTANVRQSRDICALAYINAMDGSPLVYYRCTARGLIIYDMPARRQIEATMRSK